MVSEEKQYQDALIALKTQVSAIKLQGLDNFSEGFYFELFSNYNRIFLFEIGYNLKKFLTKEELLLLNNSSYNSCLNLFQERSEQFLVSCQEKYPVEFEKLSGYDDVVNCCLYFNVSNPDYFIVREICYEMRSLKKKLSLFEDKRLTYDFLIAEVLAGLNHHLYILLEFFSVRSVIILTYTSISNFSFFHYSLFKLLFSIDLNLLYYINLLVKFMNESIILVRNKK